MKKRKTVISKKSEKIFNPFNVLFDKLNQEIEQQKTIIKTENKKIYEKELIDSEKRFKEEMKKYGLFIENGYNILSDNLKQMEMLYLKSTKEPDWTSRSYFSNLLSHIAVFGSDEDSMKSFAMLDLQENVFSLASIAAFSNDFEKRKKALSSLKKIKERGGENINVLTSLLNLVINRLCNLILVEEDKEKKEKLLSLLFEYADSSQIMIIAIDTNNVDTGIKIINHLYENKKIEKIAFICISANKKEITNYAYKVIKKAYLLAKKSVLFLGMFATIAAFSFEKQIKNDALDNLIEEKAIDQLMYVYAYNKESWVKNKINKTLNTIFSKG